MDTARVPAARPIFAPPQRATMRQPARSLPQASLYRPASAPQVGPSCPLPRARRPNPNAHRLAMEWHTRRISDAIDRGDLKEVTGELDELARLDLIRRATCMNDLDRDGLTWLMRAACAGKLYMVEFLLRQQASQHQQDNAGLNAADWALLHGHPLLAQDLAQRGAGPRCAHLPDAALTYLAVHCAHPALLRLLAGRSLGRPVKHKIHPEYGPAPSCTHVLADADGRFTPLTAVAHVHPDERAIEMALRCQDATATTLEGDCAIVLAAYSPADASEALHQMLHRRADVHARSREGWSLAHLVAAYSNRPTAGLRVLLEHGGNLHASTPEGWTPLHLLITHGDFPEAVALLLQQGADPRQITHPVPPDTPGQSALQLARIYKRAGSLACMEG